MTLQFKTGDWVKLRNGAVERIESVHPRTLTIRLKDFYPGSHYPTGLFHSERDDERDIIAIVDEPEALPEPFERYVNIIGEAMNIAMTGNYNIQELFDAANDLVTASKNFHLDHSNRDASRKRCKAQHRLKVLTPTKNIIAMIADLHAIHEANQKIKP